MLTQRERYLALMLYQENDRIPFAPGEARLSTLKAWRSQGLPEGMNYHDYLLETLRLPSEARPGIVSLPVDDRMIPQFEEEVLERREHTLIVRDWKGNICEISDEYDVTYLRDAIDFVTRRWVKCPVENWQDWEQMKERYHADQPSRFPKDFAETCRRLKDRRFPLRLHVSGLFWQLREWLGFEGLCFMFYDNPTLVADMVSFWDNFVSDLLTKTFQYIVPDILHFSEDMAYKTKAMISPQMTKRYLAPCWKHWADIAIEAGVPLRGVDSDGYIHDLLPIWMESGINMCDPIEVAAGNDLVKMRQDCGQGMAFSGGVDKRAIAAGGMVIRNEMARLLPVIQGGGFIPGCDHGVPPDISWPNFVDYSRLLAQYTGWLK